MNRKVLVVFLLIAMLYFLVSSPSFADELTVGNGQGQPWPFPSYNDREVVISLNNSAEVTSMEMDICDDVEDYLKAVDCTFTTRQVGGDCTCVATEPGGDCASVSFGGTGCSILPGTGPIFTLLYDVRPGAPLQECRDLNPQGVEVNGSSFTGQLTSGEFCFVCAADVDCISSNPNFCWDQFCNLDSQDPDYGICYSVYGLSCPDDGLYCNGLESCDLVDQECKHEYTSPETICNHPGSPLPFLCDEGLDLCYCDDDAQCDDGLNCTGVETCDTGSGGICQPGVPFCEEPTPVCDEGPPTQCFEEDVTITVGDLSGYPGSQDNEVEVSL
ncbi:MAG: hypothetical protein JRI87_12030, partial [Deltaproteobacteria bacterium]|nr:hypothetical protein [Deltaproteobacteria bacterium]